MCKTLIERIADQAKQIKDLREENDGAREVKWKKPVASVGLYIRSHQSQVEDAVC